MTESQHLSNGVDGNRREGLNVEDVANGAGVRFHNGSRVVPLSNNGPGNESINPGGAKPVDGPEKECQPNYGGDRLTGEGLIGECCSSQGGGNDDSGDHRD